MRIAIGLFAAALLAAIVVSIHLSTLDVSFGSLVYGSEVVWRGHPAAFRVATYDPRAGALLESVAAQISLVDRNGTRVTTSGRGDKFVDLAIDVPRDLGAEAALEVRIETPLGDDRARIPVEPVDATGTLRGQLLPWTSSLARGVTYRSVEPWALSVYPETTDVVAGLENRIAGRLLRSGGPAPDVSIRSPTLAAELRSDAAGLFHFSYFPVPDGQPLRFLVGPAPGDLVELPIEARARQMILRPADDHVLRAPGSQLPLSIATLPLRGPVHVDLWHGRALVALGVAPESASPRTLALRLPTAAEGLFRATAYRDFAAPDVAASTRLFAAVPNADAQDDGRAADEVLDWLADLGSGSPLLASAKVAPTLEIRRALMRLAMSRYAPEAAGAPLLRSTLESRRTEVRARRDALRSKAHAFFVLTVVVGLVLAVGWVMRHQLKMRRAVHDVVDEGVAEGERLEVEELKKLGRATHHYELALILVSFALLAYGVSLLLRSLRWEW